MPTLQDLSIAQITGTLSDAAERHVPLTISVCCGQQTITLHSSVIAFDGSQLLLEVPAPVEGRAVYEVAPAERIGGTFKLRHYKHTFSATVIDTKPARLSDGTETRAIAVCCPSKMHRLQRRAYDRADVPAGRIVRASVWLGGKDQEPAGTSPGRPVWPGRVINISAGGFQMRTSSQADDVLEPNDLLGVRLTFGAGQETLYADAQFRHSEVQGGEALLGFQFIGLGNSPEGLEALKYLCNRVSEFHQAAQAAARAAN